MIKESCGLCGGTFEIDADSRLSSTNVDERTAVAQWRASHACDGADAIGEIIDRYVKTCEILWPEGVGKTPYQKHAEMPEAVRWLIEQLAAHRSLLDGAEARVRELEIGVPVVETSGNVWACPRPNCRHRIAVGPVLESDVPVSVLISEHLEEHSLERMEQRRD